MPLASTVSSAMPETLPTAHARLAPLDDRERRGRVELLAAGQPARDQRGLDGGAARLLDPVGAGALARADRLGQVAAGEQQPGAVVHGPAGWHGLGADSLVEARPARGLAVVVDRVAARQQPEPRHRP